MATSERIGVFSEATAREILRRCHIQASSAPSEGVAGPDGHATRPVPLGETWLGIITAAGPASEADYTGPQYWVESAAITNARGSNPPNTTMPTFAAQSYPNESTRWVTATNLAEVGTHLLQPGTLVMVAEMYGLDEAPYYVFSGAETCPFIYPEDYGAVGDGTTDDTTAMQDAFNAAGTDGGGVVWLSPKTYLVQSVSLPANCWLLGASFVSTLLFKTGAASNAALLTLAGGSGVGNQRISHLTLNGNNSVNIGKGFCLYFEGTYRAEVDNIRVFDAGQDGIYFGKSSSINSAENTLQDLYITNNSGHGFNVKYATDTTFLRIESGENGLCGGCIADTSGTRITEGSFWWNANSGLWLWHSTDTRLCNCQFESNEQHGLYLQSVHSVEISNVRAYYNSHNPFISDTDPSQPHNTYSGICLDGADTVDSIVGCKWVTIGMSRSGDDADSNHPTLPWQKYGVQEVSGGTFAQCVYQVLCDHNATSPVFLVGGNLTLANLHLFIISVQADYLTCNTKADGSGDTYYVAKPPRLRSTDTAARAVAGQTYTVTKSGFTTGVTTGDAQTCTATRSSDSGTDTLEVVEPYLVGDEITALFYPTGIVDGSSNQIYLVDANTDARHWAVKSTV